jgi:hypothetical protein
MWTETSTTVLYIMKVLCWTAYVICMWYLYRHLNGLLVQIRLIICKSSEQYAVLHSCNRWNGKQMYEKEIRYLFLSPNIVSRLWGRDELVTNLSFALGHMDFWSKTLQQEFRSKEQDVEGTAVEKGNRTWRCGIKWRLSSFCRMARF